MTEIKLSIFLTLTVLSLLTKGCSNPKPTLLDLLFPSVTGCVLEEQLQGLHKRWQQWQICKRSRVNRSCLRQGYACKLLLKITRRPPSACTSYAKWELPCGLERTGWIRATTVVTVTLFGIILPAKGGQLFKYTDPLPITLYCSMSLFW